MTQCVNYGPHTKLPCSPSPVPTALQGVLSFLLATVDHIHPIGTSGLHGLQRILQSQM